jgi:hypothetical protein
MIDLLAAKKRASHCPKKKNRFMLRKGRLYLTIEFRLSSTCYFHADY